MRTVVFVGLIASAVVSCAQSEDNFSSASGTVLNGLSLAGQFLTEQDFATEGASSLDQTATLDRLRGILQSDDEGQENPENREKTCFNRQVGEARNEARDDLLSVDFTADNSKCLPDEVRSPGVSFLHAFASARCVGASTAPFNGLTSDELEARIAPSTNVCEFLGATKMEQVTNIYSKAIVTEAESPVGIALNIQSYEATLGLDGKACSTERAGARETQEDCLHLTKEVKETSGGTTVIVSKAKVSKLLREKGKKYPVAGKVEIQVGGWTAQVVFSADGGSPLVTMSKGDQQVTRHL